MEVPSWGRSGRAGSMSVPKPEPLRPGIGARSSVGEHPPYKRGVAGSKPAVPTSPDEPKHLLTWRLAVHHRQSPLTLVDLGSPPVAGIGQYLAACVRLGDGPVTAWPDHRPASRRGLSVR